MVSFSVVKEVIPGHVGSLFTDSGKVVSSEHD